MRPGRGARGPALVAELAEAGCRCNQKYQPYWAFAAHLLQRMELAHKAGGEADLTNAN